MFAAALTQRLAPNDRAFENLTDLDAARSRPGLFLSARRKQGCNGVLVERRDNKQGWGELAGKCVCINCRNSSQLHQSYAHRRTNNSHCVAHAKWMEKNAEEEDKIVVVVVVVYLRSELSTSSDRG